MKLIAHRGASAIAPENTMSAFRLGSGPIFETEWASIAGLDAGSWFSPEYAAERVPSLDQVLALEGVELELELKGYGAEFLVRVIDAVRAAQAWDRVEFTGWNLSLLALLKRREPLARIGLFSSRQPDWMPGSVFEHHVGGTAATSGADVAHVYAGDLTASISHRLHGLGLEVHANDAGSADDVRRAVLADADRVSANDVDMVLGVM